MQMITISKNFNQGIYLKLAAVHLGFGPGGGGGGGSTPLV